MNSQALFLFLVLLIGLFLSSFLGGSNCMREGYTNNYNNYKNNSNYSNNNSNSNSNSSSNSSYDSDNDDTNYNHNYDNYNHYNKSSSQLGATTQLQNGTIFTGPNGDTAVYVVGASGISSIQLKQTSGSSVVIFNQTPQGPQASSSSTTQTTGGAGTKNTFYGPGGMTATIVFSSQGNTIVFNTPSGRIIFTQVSNSSSTTGNNNISQTAYYGSTGTIMPPSSSYTAYDNSTYGVSVNGANGGSAGYYNGPNGGSAGYYNSPYGQSGGYVTGPNGNTIAGSSYNQYNSSLPQGVPGSMIPPGQQDLYILKSEVVPPVCPACPSSSACPSKKQKCPPCPACARCPEPSFECKKVPNYNAMNDEYLPQPVLNDFSTFGT
jgi:hypothetical protein